MPETVYLRMKKHIERPVLHEVQLKDIAYISTLTAKKQELENTVIYRITPKDKSNVVIDSFLIIDHFHAQYRDLEFQLIGPAQTIIQVARNQKKAPIPVVAGVWLLLFIGMAMTIMNFHYDVSMQEVQQKLHFLLTGEENEFPLWIQVPYSIGLGMGMLLFFNHWFKKRFNEEPSPLEIEIYKYQQDLDDYVTHYENKLNDAKSPE